MTGGISLTRGYLSHEREMTLSPIAPIPLQFSPQQGSVIALIQFSSFHRNIPNLHDISSTFSITGGIHRTSVHCCMVPCTCSLYNCSNCFKRKLAQFLHNYHHKRTFVFFPHQAGTNCGASSEPDFIRTYFLWKRILTIRDKKYCILTFHNKNTIV